jgi:aminoglycoside phosphotransferase family enzyme/predicted kinase
VTAIQQSGIIAFLSKGESYGVAEAVERIETHASIIFLAGDRAYKLKRAIRYPYLDYSSVALRRKACEAELALNRRTAPDLYLEVRAVECDANGRLGFAIGGQPVDWLVVMRRFDQRCLLDRVAMDGRLSDAVLRAVVDSIRRFHAEAECTKDRGGASAIRRVIDENLASMLQTPELIPAERARALHRTSVERLDRLASLLDARREQGWVRRCHGDLHLRNICLLDGRPTLFDCIEFSDDIACIDVLYDFAFLVMDLWDRGLQAQANLAFNRYFDMSDEPESVSLFPLFMSMRAAIRAHVSASAARLESSSRSRERAAILQYLGLAEDSLKVMPKRLLAIGGLSGSGKSTLARGIAPLMRPIPGARILRSDVVRKRLHDIDPEQRLPQSAYSPDTHIKVYGKIADIAGRTLEAGHSVIVDAAFVDPGERQTIARLACGCPFAGLWLEAPPDLLEARLDRRTGDASDATAAVMREQLTYQPGTITWHRIDASRQPTEILTSACERLAL